MYEIIKFSFASFVIVFIYSAVIYAGFHVSDKMESKISNEIFIGMYHVIIVSLWVVFTGVFISVIAPSIFEYLY